MPLSPGHLLQGALRPCFADAPPAKLCVPSLSAIHADLIRARQLRLRSNSRAYLSCPCEGFQYLAQPSLEPQPIALPTFATALPNPIPTPLPHHCSAGLSPSPSAAVFQPQVVCCSTPGHHGPTALAGSSSMPEDTPSHTPSASLNSLRAEGSSFGSHACPHYLSWNMLRSKRGYIYYECRECQIGRRRVGK
eukprot:RCo023823